MKKLAFLIAGLFSILLMSFGESFAAACDQSFNGGILRYNKAYGFNDTWHNNGSATDYMNSLDVDYIENGSFNTGNSTTWDYLDAGSAFDFSDTLRNNNFAVPGNSSMVIVDTKPTNWRIQDKPLVRTNGTISSHDFGLRYKITYDNSNNFPNTNDDITHTECIYYSVSSCGDGVRDDGFEICDPNDPTKSGWGNGGCNNSCEPIVVEPIATCDSITVSPITGEAPFTTTVSCSGTNADTYKIQCGNGQVLNTRTGQCSYDTGSNYQAQCIVNGNITSNSCKKTIVVTNPNPGIRIDKVDANDNDIDENKGNDTQTVALTTDAVFKIRVTNSGDEVLKTLSVFDSIAPNCAGSVTLPNTYPSSWSNFTIAGNGNHSNNTLEVGEYYEYECTKANTQVAYDNEATTRGTGVISGETVTDFDDTEVKIVTPGIQVVKIDANSNDRDLIPGNDTQSVRLGEPAIFGITVKNNGTEDLKSIILTDILVGACDSNGTFVDLSAQRFINKSGTTVNIEVSGNGNHADDIFQIGEIFTYRCEQGNTITPYTNIVEVSGIGIDSNLTVNDEDHTEVILNDEFDLALRKTLSSSTPGPFEAGETVTFDIEVINQGAINASDVEIIDYIPAGLTLNDSAWTLSGGSATRVIPSILEGTTGTVSITFTIDADATGSIINFAEISEDNNDDCDSLADDTNGNQPGENDGTQIDNNVGTGCDEGGDEDDNDFETITLGVPQVVLTKELADGQSTTVSPGDTVDYVITVINTSDVAATNLIVEDHFPADLTLADSGWTLDTNRTRVAVYNTRIASLAANSQREIEIRFTVNDGASGTILNLAIVCDADEVGEECDEPEICDPETDDCCEEGDELGDVDGCEPIIVLGPSIRIEKLDANSDDQDNNIGNDTQTVNSGETAVFKIRVTNDGTEDLDTIVLSDILAPNCAGSVTLPSTFPATFSEITSGGSGSFTNNILEVGEYFEYTCERENTTENYVNTAGVTAEGVDSGTAVDDEDTSAVLIPGSACNTLTASPNSAQNSLTSLLSCSGTNVDVFRIEVRNSAGALVETINQASGNVTLDTNGSFTASCFVNDETTTPNSCVQTLSVTSGGGGSDAVCNDLVRNENTVTCVGNGATNSIALECGTDEDGNRTFLSPITRNSGSSFIIEGDRRSANFNCSAPNPVCYVRSTIDTSISVSELGNWNTSNSCQISSNPICGDGVVQPENGETCDLGSGVNGQPGVACSATCEIGSSSSSSGGGSSSSGGSSSGSGGGGSSSSGSGGGGSSSGSGGGGGVIELCSLAGGCVNTVPNGGEIIFGPVGETIIGHNQVALGDGQTPFIFNNSDYDLSYDKFCIKRTVTDSRDGQNTVESGNQSGEYCVNLGNKMIYAYERIEMSEFAIFPSYTGNKDGIPAGESYGEATLTTSVVDGGIDYYGAYFAADLNVRVAKPAVVTLGGGTSFVKDTTSGDVAKVTDGVSGYSDNKNFVGTSVSDSGISSYASENTDTVAIEEAQKENEKFTKSVETVTNTTVASSSVSGYNNFSNYNGLENVYIVTGKNIELGTLPSDIDASTTYIVEGGDLTITQDIVTDENIAFVVKGGNIIVSSDVTQLNGTYISIPTSSGGGNISSNPSQEQLVVDGSLYGNIDDLVDNRFYIAKEDTQLSVGTIVSFGSRLFSKPAPLVSQFVGEYLESEKVSR